MPTLSTSGVHIEFPKPEYAYQTSEGVIVKDANGNLLEGIHSIKIELTPDNIVMAVISLPVLSIRNV